MRTDTLKKTEGSIAETSSSSDCKETMKVVRKSLHPLQIAAGDKENLVGAGRMHSSINDKDGKNIVLNSKQTNPSPKKEKQKINKEKKTAIEKDLTSEAGPSEHYWEVLAETRRKALEKALVENQQLHERLAKLTEEKEQLKKLVDEAQVIIDTLNEIIAEMDNEDDSRNDEEISRRA